MIFDHDKTQKQKIKIALIDFMQMILPYLWMLKKLNIIFIIKFYIYINRYIKKKKIKSTGSLSFKKKKMYIYIYN